MSFVVLVFAFITVLLISLGVIDILTAGNPLRASDYLLLAFASGLFTSICSVFAKRGNNGKNSKEESSM